MKKSNKFIELVKECYAELIQEGRIVLTKYGARLAENSPAPATKPKPKETEVLPSTKPNHPPKRTIKPDTNPSKKPKFLAEDDDAPKAKGEPKLSHKSRQEEKPKAKKREPKAEEPRRSTKVDKLASDMNDVKKSYHKKFGKSRGEREFKKTTEV